MTNNLVSLLCDVYPGSTDSVGESVFIGILTSVAFGIFLWIINYISSKKQNQKLKEQHIKSEEDEYITSLKDIAKSSGRIMKFDYEGTVSQLYDLCNPKNFINPYQPDKLEIATKLYSELNNLSSPYNKHQVRTLRRKADELLGIKLSSEYEFSLLKSVFNPQNFVDDTFDERKLLVSNKAYQYILTNKTDVRKLQKFADRIGMLDLNDGQVSEQIDKGANGSVFHTIEVDDSDSTIAWTIITILVIVLFCLIGFAYDNN